MLPDSLVAIANLLLPEVLVTYFDLKKHVVKDEELHFYFTEQNKVPDGYSVAKLHSKGFFPEATVQDFPIRGKNVFLHIIRRRWVDQDTGTMVTRDWQLVAKGTRITSEFATFLKEIRQ